MFWRNLYLHINNLRKHFGSLGGLLLCYCFIGCITAQIFTKWESLNCLNEGKLNVVTISALEY